MDWVGSVLVGLNAVLGAGAGLYLANSLRKLRPAWSFPRCLIIMLGVYLLECIAIAAGMLIPVFSLGLAVIWGMVIGSRLRSREPGDGVMRFAVQTTVYTCVPTATFLSVPLVLALTGRSIIDKGEAVKFGIPHFMPWPADTILGFFLCLVVCVCALKAAVTLGIIHLYLRPRGNRADDKQPEV